MSLPSGGLIICLSHDIQVKQDELLQIILQALTVILKM